MFQGSTQEEELHIQETAVAAAEITAAHTHKLQLIQGSSHDEDIHMQNTSNIPESGHIITAASVAAASSSNNSTNSPSITTVGASEAVVEQSNDDHASMAATLVAHASLTDASFITTGITI